jgi:hypothetical protein
MLGTTIHLYIIALIEDASAPGAAPLNLPDRLITTLFDASPAPTSLASASGAALAEEAVARGVETEVLRRIAEIGDAVNEFLATSRP